MPLSTTQTVNPQSVTAPQAGYKFYQPWFEDYQRRVGASAFGSDGIGGLMNQPQQIPIEGTAGLTPLQMQARQSAMSAGPDMGAYNTATNLMGQGAGMIGQGADTLGTAQGMYGQGTGLVGQGSGLYGLGTQMAGQAANMFAPGAAQQFYNPYENQVIDDTLERMRKTSAQQDIAGRAQDISSGAFGGSRGRLLAGERERESERGILQALSGIRSQGYQQAQGAAQTAGQGLGSLAGQLGQFGQGLGTLGGQLGQFGQGLTSTGGQYGQLGQQIGQLGQGVAGLGQQKSGELANYSNLLNTLGTQGQTTQQGGLSRLYQAAKQRADEPWNRLMKGQTLLSGMKPGELIGGYETKVLQPQTYQQPTSAGNTVAGIGGILGLGNTLADIGKTFGWWGGPTEEAAGGFIEKQPRDYNAGGIVSGIVPINMQEGGDASVEEDIPEWVIEAMESGAPMEKKAATDWFSTYVAANEDEIIDEQIKEAGLSGPALALALMLSGGSQIRKGRIIKGGKDIQKGIGALVPTGRSVVTKGKDKLQTWTSQLNKKLKDSADKANRRKRRQRTTGGPGGAGKTPLLTGPGTGAGGAGAPSIGSKAWDIMKKIGKYGGIGTVGIGGGSVLLSGLGSDDEVPEEEDRNTEKLQEKVNALEEKYAKAKNAKERKEIIDDIVKTTARLSDMMNAPGTRQVSLADAANIFAQERRNIGQEDADVERFERLSEMTGGMFSPAQLWESELTNMPPMGGIDRKDLVRNIIEYMFPEPGVGERLPEEEIRMRQMEAQLQTMTPEDLLDLIKQGYGQDPTSQSIRITAEDGLG